MKYPGLVGRDARLAELLALLLQKTGYVEAPPESVDALIEVAGRVLSTDSPARDRQQHLATGTMPSPGQPQAQPGRRQLNGAAALHKLNEMGFNKVDPSESELELAWVLANGIRKKNRLFAWVPEELGSWLPEGQRMTLAEQVVSYVENAAESGNLELADALGEVLGVSMYAASAPATIATDPNTQTFDIDAGEDEQEAGPRG